MSERDPLRPWREIRPENAEEWDGYGLPPRGFANEEERKQAEIEHQKFLEWAEQFRRKNHLGEFADKKNPDDPNQN